MLRKHVVLAASALLVVGCSTGATTTATASTTPSPGTTKEVKAPAYGTDYGPTAPRQSSSVQPMDIGGFITNADLPHFSKTAGDVSVHGWWEKTPVKATPAKKAVVTVWLQAKGHWSGASWFTAGYNKGTVAPGPGSGRWVSARVTCKQGPIGGDGKYSFRAKVDVDLVGYADSPEKAYGRTASIACLP